MADEAERDLSDRAFDEAVQKAFSDEGLIVTHYVIVVEVMRESGTLETVNFESENISSHLIKGMLYSALDFYSNPEEED